MSDAQLQSLFEPNGFLLLWPLENVTTQFTGWITVLLDTSTRETTNTLLFLILDL